MSFESVFKPTDVNLYLAGLLAGDLGFISAYRSVPRIELLKVLGNLLDSNPNATSAEIAAVLKAPVRMVETMKPFYQDAHDFNENAAFICKLVPTLPHPVQGVNFVIVFSLLAFLTLLCVAGRLYARYHIEGGIRAYDWMIVGAFIATFGSGLTTCIGVLTFSKPRTNWDLTQNGHDALQAMAFSGFYLYGFSMLAIKLSILTFYFNLSSWRPFRWSVVFTMTIVIIPTVVCTILDTFKTKPILQWTDRFFNHAVLNEAAILLSFSVFLILTDILIWLIPLPMVWKLKNVKTVTRSDRWYAVLVFGIGMLVVAAAIARILVLRTNLEALNGIYPDDKYSIISIIEPLLAIICSCFPALRALYKRYTSKASAVVVIKAKTTMADAGVGTDDKMYFKGSMQRINSMEDV